MKRDIESKSHKRLRIKNVLILLFASILVVLCITNLSANRTPPDLSDARQILDRYLKSPHPIGPSKTDPYGTKAGEEANNARNTRQTILAELKTVSKEAVLSAVEPVLFEEASPVQRHEIVGTLGAIHTRACAELLHRVLQDVREPKDQKAAFYEVLTRSSAVHELRRMSSRTHRNVGRSIQYKPDSEPKVSDLVPYLISAANDKAERVRVSALYALADSFDPIAVTELRNRLSDKSEKVRFHAACFLTGHQDASGLPELRKALIRFQEKGSTSTESAFGHYSQQEMLLTSFERITGKSLGEIPMNPSLVSSFPGEAEKRYAELLAAWEDWWDQQPDPKPENNP